MTAEEFAAWRERMGLTQERAAEGLGIPRGAFQDWERG